MTIHVPSRQESHKLTEEFYEGMLGVKVPLTGEAAGRQVRVEMVAGVRWGVVEIVGMDGVDCSPHIYRCGIC